MEILNKVCSKCNELKILSDFHKYKNSKDGLKPYCIECAKAAYNNYKKNNIDKVRDSQKIRRLRDKEKLNRCAREYYKNNREKILLRQKEKPKEKDKIYRLDNADTIKVYATKWREDNKEYIREYAKSNRQKISTQQRKKKQEDSFYRLRCNLRRRIKETFNTNGFTKKSKTAEILGCTFEEFKLHLESKFEPWMAWDNRGLYNGELNCGWDIDHIIPVSSAITEEDIIKLNHYTNLQPLCSYINRNIKRDNIIY